MGLDISDVEKPGSVTRILATDKRTITQCALALCSIHKEGIETKM